MNRRFVFLDRQGRRILAEGDFPLALGGGEPGAIAVPGATRAAAYIGLSDGYLFVQPASEDVAPYYNDAVLRESAWLADGDRLRVKNVEFAVSANAAEMVIRVLEREGELGDTLPPRPPDSPPPKLEIEPVVFRPAPMDNRSGRAPLTRTLIWTGFLVGLSLLLATAWFVFTARQLTLHIEPTPDSISLDGGLYVFELGESYLLQSGQYTLNAVKEGYKPIAQQLEVDGDRSQTLTFQMEKLPGFLEIIVHEIDKPANLLKSAEIVVDGKPAGVLPLEPLELSPGPHKLVVKAERYLEQAHAVDIQGRGITQSLTVALVPGWGDVTIESIPEGADVAVDGEPKGKTPITLSLDAGPHALKIGARGYKSRERHLEVEANTPLVLDPIRLQPADAQLSVRSNPAGAGVTVGDAYKGQTPVNLALNPGVTHRVRFSKPGYQNAERKIKLVSGESKTVSVDLVAVKGVIHLKGIPAGATLTINGKVQSAANGKIELPAFEHRIKVTKEGFESFQTTITPRPGFDQELQVALKALESPKAKIKSNERPMVIRAANGYTLRLIVPGSFKMGSSRREQGRRSNETLRNIQLKRPFYIGTHEVTNKEFRAFSGEHNSGSIQSISLNRDNLPVADVTWQQAAQFCNWLSTRDGLPNVYRKKGNDLVASDPMGTGYRLATEAEWEYCARYDGSRAQFKYPWGKAFPPKNKSVNIADTTAKALFSIYVSGYTDGYAAASPTGKFPANALGLHDMGGNVAEWCHDFYSIYSAIGQKIDVDPSGPVDGRHHVVKGPSWKYGSISTLRSAYRDYNADKRMDVGFRVCRYLAD